MATTTKRSKVIPQKDHEIESTELSPLVSVRDIKEQLKEVYQIQSREKLLGARIDDIQGVMGVSDDVIQECADLCKPENLLPEGGVKTLQLIKRKELPQDSGLKSMGLINEPYYRSLPPALLKYLLHPVFIRPPFPSPQDFVTCPEIVLSVLVYHPIKRVPFVLYYVLGSQLLSSLKDKIFCPRDYAINEDFSENPDHFDKTKFPVPPTPSNSGFFFINDTFYNDMRNAESVDYSSVIMEWSTSSSERLTMSSRLNHFSALNMSTCSFNDLSLRLGYPYLYCHHGNCEHVIIFTDIRLFASTDIQDKNYYPLTVEFSKLVRKRCAVCTERTACWVTLNDTMATESPAYFCHSCLIMLHYDKDNKKLCNFKAYPYFDEVTALLERAHVAGSDASVIIENLHDDENPSLLEED